MHYVVLPLLQELEPGSTELYAVNQEVEQWLQWRKVNGKPLAAMHQMNDIFIVVTREELDDFLQFRHALRLLETPQDKQYYYVPKCELLSYWGEKRNKSLVEETRFGAVFIKISNQDMYELSLWAQKQQKALSEGLPPFSFDF